MKVPWLGKSSRKAFSCRLRRALVRNPIAFLLTFILLTLVLTPTAEAYSTSFSIGTAAPGAQYGVHDCFFYAHEKYWILYPYNTDLVYRTSFDYVTWSDPTQLVTGLSSYCIFAFHYDGTYLHLAYHVSTTIYYRQCTPNADGTMTMGDERTVKTSVSITEGIDITLNSSGYPWISYFNTYGYAIGATQLDGSAWGTAKNIGNTCHNPKILPLPGNALVVIGVAGSVAQASEKIGYMYFDGASWGSYIQGPQCSEGPFFAARSPSNESVYVLFVTSSNYTTLQLLEWKSTGWLTPRDIHYYPSTVQDGNGVSSVHGSLCFDTDNDVVFIFYPKQDGDVTYRIYDWSTVSAETVLDSSASASTNSNYKKIVRTPTGFLNYRIPIVSYWYGSAYAYLNSYLYPPEVTSSPILYTTEDWSNYSYAPSADQAIDAWGITTNASFLSINPGSGVVTCASTPTNLDVGTYYVNISATNDNGTAYQNYTLTVNNTAPIIYGNPDLETAFGNYYTYDPWASDEDYGLTYSMNSSSADLRIDPATGTVQGKVNDFGTITVNITADDGHGGYAYQNFTIQVNVLWWNLHLEIIHTEYLHLRVQYDFLCDAPHDAVKKIMWNFGDGRGSKDVSPVHQYDAPGTYTVTVALFDENGNIGYSSTYITIGEGGPTSTKEKINWWLSTQALLAFGLVFGCVGVAAVYVQYSRREGGPNLLILISVLVALAVILLMLFGGAYQW